MKTQIDTLESTSGWSMSAGSSVSVQTWPNTISSGHTSSLKFNLLLNGTAYKLFGSSAGIDVADYEWVAFGQKFNLAAVDYQETTDFALKVEITWNTGAKSYYVPLTAQFDRCIFRTEGAATILGVKFTALKAVQFFCSDLIAFTSNYPADIYQGLKDAIDAQMEIMYPIVAGTITAAAGDRTVTIDDYSMLERYSLIKFGTEQHKVDKFDQTGGATFFTTEDGAQVVSNHTAADVELQFPVSLNPSDIAITCPGVSLVGGFDPELWPDNPIQQDDWDTWNVNGTRFDGFKGASHDYKIFTVGLSFVHDNLEIIKTAMRRAFAIGYIWINGLRIEWLEDEAPSYRDKSDGGNDIIPQVTWNFRFRVEEEPADSVQVNIPLDVTQTTNIAE